MSKILITLITMLAPAIALAHSGHGHIDATTAWHWLLEFDHIGWLIPVVVVLFVVVRRKPQLYR